MYVTDGGVPKNMLVCIGVTFSGPVMKTQFLVENELRKKQALKLYTVRLMPTEEAMRSLWDMST